MENKVSIVHLGTITPHAACEYMINSICNNRMYMYIYIYMHMKFSPTTPPDPNTPLKTAKTGKSEMGQEKGESYVHEKYRNLKGPHTFCIILDP